MNNFFWPGKSISSISISIITCQVSLDIPNLLAVLSSQKLDNNCEVLFTDHVASFNAFSWDITSQLLENGYHFLLQSICSHFTGNAYYVLTFLSGILCAFNQHWCSIVTNQLDRRVLTYFVTDTSACNLEKDYSTYASLPAHCIHLLKFILMQQNYWN